MDLKIGRIIGRKQELSSLFTRLAESTFSYAIASCASGLLVGELMIIFKNSIIMIQIDNISSLSRTIQGSELCILKGTKVSEVFCTPCPGILSIHLSFVISLDIDEQIL